MADLHLVRGADPALRSRAVSGLVDELVGERERAFTVDEHTVPGRTAPEAGAVVDALVTALASPPFVTDRRVVVVHDADELSGEDAARLAEALRDRAEGVAVVVVVAGRVPKALADALAGAEAHEVDAPTAEVLAAECRRAGIHLSAAAARRVGAHLGDDAGRVGALVELLAAAYGPGADLDIGEVEPYLGEAGVVRPWELTDRIEAGDAAGALAVLHRLLHAVSSRQPRPVHPLQVLGILHGRLRRLARCDDPAVAGPADAAKVLGGSPFAARKAWEASRVLGADGIRRAYRWLAEADLDLKGRRAAGDDAVLAVLVVRLARLFATAGSAPARTASRSARRGRRPS